MRTGGKIVVDHLVSQGVRHLFMVPGESFLGLLDALHDETGVQPVTARNEAGAVMMAEATAKLTGTPGVAVVTRGPGAANALAGVYIAQQDQTPLVLLVGLPARAKKGLPAFQQIDLAGVFGGLAKNVAIAESASALPQRLAFAFRLAASGRPGPVVLGLPEDVLLETSKTASVRIAPPQPPSPAKEDLDRINGLLAHADRPLVIAGPSLWSEDAARHLARFAERYDIPVASAFRRQDRLDNQHTCYAGHLGFVPDTRLAAAVHEADVVIVLGQCLNEVTTRGFTLLEDGEDDAKQKVVLVAPDAATPDRPYIPHLSINACPIKTVEALAHLPTPGRTPPWPKWRQALRAAYEASVAPPSAAKRIQLDEIFFHLARALREHAIVCSGAGAYAAALHRHFVYRTYPAQLAPISGTMGYGLPAAIAAKLAHPAKTIVAIAGDGCLQMTVQELATLAQLDLPVVVIVANNAALGTIRDAQLSRAPHRLVATTLVNPDFGALARAHGMAAYTVRETTAFPDALQQALASNSPALIELDLTQC